MDINKLLDQIPSTGNFFKTKEPGDYVCRIVSEIFSFQRAPYSPGQSTTVGFVCRVIDRANGEIKIWAFSAAIMRCIGDLAKDADYSFVGLPGYDLKVKRAGTGKDTRWSILPRPEVPLTSDEVKMVADLEAEDPITDVHMKLANKEREKMNGGAPQPPLPKDDIKVEDIPF